MTPFLLCERGEPQSHGHGAHNLGLQEKRGQGSSGSPRPLAPFQQLLALPPPDASLKQPCPCAHPLPKPHVDHPPRVALPRCRQRGLMESTLHTVGRATFLTTTSSLSGVECVRGFSLLHARPWKGSTGRTVTLVTWPRTHLF